MCFCDLWRRKNEKGGVATRTRQTAVAAALYTASLLAANLIRPLLLLPINRKASIFGHHRVVAKMQAVVLHRPFSPTPESTPRPSCSLPLSPPVLPALPVSAHIFYLYFIYISIYLSILRMSFIMFLQHFFSLLLWLLLNLFLIWFKVVALRKRTGCVVTIRRKGFRIPCCSSFRAESKTKRRGELFPSPPISLS